MKQRYRADLLLPRNYRRSIGRAGNSAGIMLKFRRCSKVCGTNEMTRREEDRHDKLH